jgi:organic radical activating enzyme|tara:strand:+ start:260 stop:1663 length:1404 start_codon:yes stop_codon:yes gene_type:complete
MDEHIEKTRDLLEQTVSPTFCLAKFHHTTIYLQTGETHSCYHPSPHKIPLEELEASASALHNTKHKKQERKEMLEGKKPKGCQYCWNVESMGEEYTSDRHERNASIYRPERVEEIQKYGSDLDINPEYIEISFGNECNFKCGYCHPKASSTYWKEIEKFGPYDMVENHRLDIDWIKIFKKEEENPYVKAWWEWWPEVRKTLSILRITGGEPLLQQSTWKLLDNLSKYPLPDLEINVNSNLGVKPILVDRLCKYVKDFEENDKIKRFKLFTSLDTWGPKAEYIRFGLDLDVWEKNFHHYLNTTNANITFMMTFNILAVSSFKTILQKILEWRQMYPDVTNGASQLHRVRFDTPYLKEPLQYDMNILPKNQFMHYMNDTLAFMKDNVVKGDPTKFSDLEYWKFKRVVDYMNQTNYSKERLLEGRSDFYNWFTELDRRRGTNFDETFPEYREFKDECRLISEAKKAKSTS